MDKKPEKIIERILNEMGGQTGENKENLFNLIQSINLENQLNNVDYETLKIFKSLIMKKILIKIGVIYIRNYRIKIILLDTSEYKKFTTFNSLIKGFNIPSKIKYDNHLHLIIFLGIYYLYELIYRYTFLIVDKKITRCRNFKCWK